MTTGTLKAYKNRPTGQTF